MSTAVAQIPDLKEKIADHIRNTFGSLIPEEVWGQMIDKEMKAFFEDFIEWEVKEVAIPGSNANYGWQERTKMAMVAKMTPFRALVWQAMSPLVHKKIDEALTTGQFGAVIERIWGNDGTEGIANIQLSEHLDAKLDAMAPKIVAEVFRGSFADALVMVRTKIINDLKPQ